MMFNPTSMACTAASTSGGPTATTGGNNCSASMTTTDNFGTMIRQVRVGLASLCGTLCASAVNYTVTFSGVQNNFYNTNLGTTIFIHTQLLDEDMITFYDNDVATITVNTTSYSHINSFTTNVGTIQSVVRSVTTVN